MIVRLRSHDVDLLERARALAIEVERLLSCQELTTPTATPSQYEPLPQPDLFESQEDQQRVVSPKFLAHLANLEQKRARKDAKKRAQKPSNEEPQS
jgi:hypothetical protein